MRHFAVILFALLQTTAARADLRDVFNIGNSLTWDTVPTLLDGDVDYHVDCGKSLPYIYANPDAPCVASSTLWPSALSSNQYTFLTVQPHYDTVANNVTVISQWMAMQPDAILVIHQAWAPHADFETEYHTTTPPTDGATWTRSPTFFADLAARLQAIDPGREIRFTLTADALDVIYHDIASDAAPFDSFDELYRDSLHLGTGSHDSDDASGRYLAHNLMRFALDQPFSAVGFDNVPADRKAYLDGVLASVTTSVASVPESSAIAALAGLFLVALLIAAKKPIESAAGVTKPIDAVRD